MGEYWLAAKHRKWREFCDADVPWPPRAVRRVDQARNALVYLTCSDRVIEDSPQNSVTAVSVDRATPIPPR